MANPQITSITYSPAVPGAGYIKGTVVTATVRYTDTDSTPAVPEIPAYTLQITGSVRDQNGAVGALTQNIQFAAVPAKPAYNDIDPNSASFVISDGRPVTLVSRDNTTAIFTFVA